MKIILNIFKVIFVVLTVANTFALVILFRDVALINDKINEVSNRPAASAFFPTSKGEEVDLSGYATKDYVAEAVSGISIPVADETTAIVTETVADTPKTSIIPINATYETQSLDWINVPNSDFYLDLANDYAEDAVVTWDAFIHELHGNGRAEARLMDVTHGIVVVNSEVATNNATSTLVTSGNVAIWKGKNLYRVQVKSEKGFPVYFNSGRLKIRY